MCDLPYDKKDAKSILRYAKKLIGKRINEISNLKDYGVLAVFADQNRKGGIGNFIETFYFSIPQNSSPLPDFPEAGLELKVTPYELTKGSKNKPSTLKAGERLVLSMIDYSGPISPNLKKSHVWQKCEKILLIYYFRDKNITDNMSYRIDYVDIFTPPQEDLKIIEQDYKIIANKIMAGKADQLSESDTMYLGACTKGSTAAKSLVMQFYKSPNLAKKRAFCYKNSYMTHVLQNYLAKQDGNLLPHTGKPEASNLNFEPIIKSSKELEKQTFENIVISKIDAFVGKTDIEICNELNCEYTQNKAQWTTITYKMLGIKNNQAEEFSKANIVVKVIRIESNGKMKEHMSFPTFKYKELANETWESSNLNEYFETTKFLFVVFKNNGENYILSGCQFWNMPQTDLQNEMKECWEKVKKIILDGIILKKSYDSKGKIIIENNLPSSASENRITHVRPHASKRYYVLENGEVIGNGSKTDSNELPDGRWMPNFCFWLNNTYILSILKDNLKN